jgi:NADH:ubiquinone oxidoreductase subunit 5 (subunit L)/multisubunit Na+/H+ antiporter MnhA subunit
VAGIFHIINHAIFRASLFMAAGIIDHECGTWDMRRVNGMFSYMPVTATLVIIAAASMAGVPLLNGFLSKRCSSPKRSLTSNSQLLAGCCHFLRLSPGCLPLLGRHASFMTCSSMANRLPCRVTHTSHRAGCGHRSSCSYCFVWWWECFLAMLIRQLLPLSLTVPVKHRTLGGPAAAIAWPRATATLALVAAGPLLAVLARPLSDYTERTARQLHAPGAYVAAVLGPAPARIAREAVR